MKHSKNEEHAKHVEYTERVECGERASETFLERIKTGIPGLDELLEGGLPRGTATIVAGGPGTGKSILSAQFVHAGASFVTDTNILMRFTEVESIMRRAIVVLKSRASAHDASIKQFDITSKGIVIESLFESIYENILSGTATKR